MRFIKNIISKLNKNISPKLIKDSYFGEMESNYDPQEECHFLNKDIELEGIHTPVILYLQAHAPCSNSHQQRAYELIQKEFPHTWGKVILFLTAKDRLISPEQLRKEYRLESITIPGDVDPDRMKWEIDLINLRDGFSHILIEMEGNTPVHFSVDA